MNYLTDKCLFVLLIGVLGTLSLFSQSHTDFYSIRSYNNTLLVSLQEQANNQLSIGDYGSISYLNGTNQSLSSRYLYQGQEYSESLGLYFYPFRVYSSEEKRFFSPDPKSQYHSPFLFVASDPINFIDHDGKAGKALFLYAEDRRSKTESYKAFMDALPEELPDAYHVPMNKFINKEVGDLEDWNGNVFILGHMGTTPGKEISVEEAEDVEDIETVSRFTNIEYNQVSKTWSARFDGDEMGRLLRNFSKERNVPIRNVVAGGCHGAEAAEAIQHGFLGFSTPRFGAERHPVDFAGVRRGRTSVVQKLVDARTRKSEYIYYTQKARDPNAPPKSRFRKAMDKIKRKIKGKRVARMNEMNEIVNGRIPQDFQRDFEFFHGDY